MRQPLRTQQCLQPLHQRLALGAERLGLLVEIRVMLERKARRLGIQHADVVGRADLVELRSPGRRTGQIADAGARQPPLGAGAHHRQVRPGLQLGQPAGTTGKGRIGLVQHHQTVGGLQDGAHVVRIEQVARGVVRIGQEDQRRAVRLDGLQHRLAVQTEIRPQRHRHETDACQPRPHLVHHERGRRRHDRGPRLGHQLAQQADQLIRAVAQHQPVNAVQPVMPGNGLFQRRIGVSGRIAVDGQRRQTLRQLSLQRPGQPPGVLHRIQLDGVGGIGHVVGSHALHVRTHMAFDPGRDLGRRDRTGRCRGHTSVRSHLRGR